MGAPAQVGEEGERGRWEGEGAWVHAPPGVWVGGARGGSF